MPTDGSVGTSSDGPTAAAPPVACDFGPFGEQTRVNLNTLGTQKLCKLTQHHHSPLPFFFFLHRADTIVPSLLLSQLSSCRKAVPTCSTLERQYGVLTGVLFIQTTDRVRKTFYLVPVALLTSRVEPDCSYKHYLAVAPLPSRTHSPEIGVKVPCPSRACVQLWSLGPSDGVEGSGDDKGEMRCEMVLCIDSGPALEIKWCPLPSHDSVCLPKFLIPTGSWNSRKRLKSWQVNPRPLQENWVY